MYLYVGGEFNQNYVFNMNSNCHSTMLAAVTSKSQTNHTHVNCALRCDCKRKH